MRRAKVKATICLGRKKTESPKITNEIPEAIPISKSTSYNIETKLVQKSEDLEPNEDISKTMASSNLFKDIASVPLEVISKESTNEMIPTENSISSVPIIKPTIPKDVLQTTPDNNETASHQNFLAVKSQVDSTKSSVLSNDFNDLHITMATTKGISRLSPNVDSEILLSSIIPAAPTEDIPPKFPNTLCEIDTTENSISPLQIEQECPKLPSVNSNIPTPMVLQAGAIASGNQKKNSLLLNSLLNRSRFKAVPKLKGRKISSIRKPIENEEISKNIELVSTTEENLNLKESISHSPVKSVSLENVDRQNNLIPPSSPNKLCRSKVKAIPILSNRRYHSTSESEDCSSRTRTDSQSSNFCGMQETADEQVSPSKTIELNTEVKKKLRKSEGSKKLAEARREFAKKFVDAKPDYKRLTMMDLIFFNPATNPMKYENTKSDISTNDPNVNTEDMDDPVVPKTNDESQENEKMTDKSEDEDEIIGPRIKIGPTGEIILDEKSLVIENKKAKKALEAIENSKLIDGDADRPYGVMKRSARSKWSCSDTLKFYRALSTVGTDFALMTELFPSRNRRELKLKFKKEEKINRGLVDKAMLTPGNFNFEELKTEFKMMEIEELEIKQQQINKKEMLKKRQDKKSQNFIKITQENTVDNVCDTNNTTDLTLGKTVNQRKRKKKEIRSKLPKQPKLSKLQKPPNKLDILSALNESDSSELNSDNDSKESFVVNKIHTTRYGRKTKQREVYEPNIELEKEIIIQKRIQRPETPQSEPEQTPGSLMVVATETSDGPVVQIFMVTEDKAEKSNEQGEVNTKNLLPIASIKTGEGSKEEIIENNYTIPEDGQGDVS